jgi:hypothetical protein
MALFAFCSPPPLPLTPPLPSLISISASCLLYESISRLIVFTSFRSCFCLLSACCLCSLALSVSSLSLRITLSLFRLLPLLLLVVSSSSLPVVFEGPVWAPEDAIREIFFSRSLTDLAKRTFSALTFSSYSILSPATDLTGLFDSYKKRLVLPDVT